jgi:hypothetical protein
VYDLVYNSMIELKKAKLSRNEMLPIRFVRMLHPPTIPARPESTNAHDQSDEGHRNANVEAKQLRSL